jgi:MFS family permease
MDRILSRVAKIDNVLLIFVAILILSFHFFFMYFINSTYVIAFVGEKMVSVIYAIGAVLNISLFLLIPRLLRNVGVMRMTMMFTFIEALSLILLAFPIHPSIAILAFLLHMTVASALIYCMDIILEQYSNVEEMGAMRGMFLTMWNIPPIVTPFIAGLVLGNASTAALRLTGDSLIHALYNEGFWKIYIISAVFLIPFIVILRTNLMNFKDPEYTKMDVKQVFASFYHNKNIFDVFTDRLLLNLYFAWNVVYLPIYLHEYIGFSWSEIGIIISSMLLPFVLFQRAIGKIQDKKHQEKQLLISGFMILAIGTIVQPFVTSANIYAWMILLFVTHIGAAFVEVSSESYFFKHVSRTNSSYISLFRMTRTLPYIIMPPIIALCLTFLPFSYMFLVLGLIMLIGVRYAFLIDQE